MKMEIKDIRTIVNKTNFVSFGFDDGNTLTVEQVERINKLAVELLELGVNDVIVVRK